ncbi:MAG: hypothetical protein WHT06_11860 [Desulfobacterales bacterium]
MPRAEAIKKGTHQAGKAFVLLFNRVSMYGPGHPFSEQAVADFYAAIGRLLEATSPVVVIYDREQFFLEEEPIDPNLNVFKLAAHFKKAGITSISIERGLELPELRAFVEIFLDPRGYPDAEAMRRATAARQVRRIRINHVFFRKVTEDERIVEHSRAAEAEAAVHELDRSRRTEEALGLIAGKLLADELGGTLSVRELIADPPSVARRLLASPRDAPGQATGGQAAEVSQTVSARFAALGASVREAVRGDDPPPLAELAQALLRVKGEVLATLEAGRLLGAGGAEGEAIRREVESVTDAVILDLVRLEYRRGGKSPEELAFFLERLLPGPEELRRLLPRIREILLEEGLAPEEFARLLRLLAREHKQAGLMAAVEREAEALGAEGGELIERWAADPAAFTRVLFLAAEIQKEAGSPEPLYRLLVDHLEQLLPGAVKPRPGEDAAGAAERLERLVSALRPGLIDRLRAVGTDGSAIAAFEARLAERLESAVRAVCAEISRSREPLPGSAEARRTLLRTLAESLPAEHPLKPLLASLRVSFQEKGLDENDAARILSEMEAARRRTRAAGRPLEEFLFNRRQTRSLLEVEMARARRYGTDLSAIAFWLYRPGKRAAGKEAAISPGETLALLRALRGELRTTDWLGVVNGRLFVAVLPMTSLREAHLAARRLLRRLNTGEVAGAGGCRIAGTAVHYDPSRIADPQALIALLECGQAEMDHRLRNLQDYM